jgi:alpha-L-fucosidase
LKREKSFNRLVLQEYIPLGQRVDSVRVFADGELIAQATTVGYKRILLFETVAARRLRIEFVYAGKTFAESAKCP